MPIPAAAIAGISAGAKLLGGLFGSRGKKKKEEAARKAQIGAAELKHNMGEDQRLAQQAAGQSILGQLAGKGFTGLDPETAAALKQRRSYDFSKAVPEAGAGAGSDLLSGLFGGISDVASQYGANEQDMAPMSPGQPNVPMQETIDVPDLRSRVGAFDTGIDYRLDPYGRG